MWSLSKGSKKTWEDNIIAFYKLYDITDWAADAEKIQGYYRDYYGEYTTIGDKFTLIIDWTQQNWQKFLSKWKDLKFPNYK